MTYIENLAVRAKTAKAAIANASTREKNRCLLAMADAIREERAYLLE